MQTKLPDSLTVTADDDNPDKEYKKQIKYHRNTIEKFNHLFRIWTHPFMMLIYLIILLLADCVFYVLSKSQPDEIWICETYNLLSKALSYVATFVFSSIFTWFLENHNKIKKDND